eukprot:COSAG01_NODE_1080_length_11819_cov_29.816212_4_plen_108_part_00
MLPNISAGRKSELGFTPVLALAKLGKSTVQGLYLQEQPKLVSFACSNVSEPEVCQPPAMARHHLAPPCPMPAIGCLGLVAMLVACLPDAADGGARGGHLSAPDRPLG